MAGNSEGARRINTRAKGQRGEREIAKRFVEIMTEIENGMLDGDELAMARTGGSEAVKRNAMQSDRGGFDLVGIPGLAVEVKFCETLLLDKWWAQTVEQAQRGRLQPVLIYRQTRRPWRVRTFMPLHRPSSVVTDWVIAEIAADDFFAWYAKLYRHYLLTGEI